MANSESSTELDEGAERPEHEQEFNAGDPTSVGERKKKHKTDELERLKGLSELMSHKQGRRYMWWLLTQASVLNQSFNPDPYIHAFNAGARNIGLAILAEVMKHHPDQYLQMTRENANV